MLKKAAGLVPPAMLLFLVLYAAGCAPSGLYLAGRSEVLKPGQILDVRTGGLLTEEQLIERLARERIVFIGEYHDHIVQHQNQLRLIAGLQARYPDLVVGLEMFSRSEQKFLDEWTGGRMDRKDFMELAGGTLLGGDIFEAYLPFLEWAREKKVKLLALNAPRSVTAKIAREGMEALSEEDRKTMARDIEVGPAVYKERVAEAFGGHAGLVDLDNFFAAQVTWDETMAETLADFLTSPEGVGRKAVVIAGNEHVYQRYGVPDRAARRLNEPQAVIFSPVAAEDLKIGPQDADYVWVTEVQPPKKRLRLGVRISDAEKDRLVVEEITPGSEAERIGLKPGDVLISLDEKPLNSLMDFHRAAVEGGVDVEHRIEVERDGLRVGFSFRFRESDE